MSKIALVIGYGSIGKRHVKNLLECTKYEILILTKRKINNKKEPRIKKLASKAKEIHTPDPVTSLVNLIRPSARMLAEPLNGRKLTLEAVSEYLT